VQRLALRIADAIPAVTAFGPIAGIAVLLTSWLARLPRALAA
jgi:hypothetical protein